MHVSHLSRDFKIKRPDTFNIIFMVSRSNEGDQFRHVIIIIITLLTDNHKLSANEHTSKQLNFNSIPNIAFNNCNSTL
jgi:hypothetical protein